MIDANLSEPDHAPHNPPRSLVARAWEWLIRGSSLREAPSLDATQRALRERARLALSLGDACMEGELPDGAGLDDIAPAQAVSLYREATYWALAARDIRVRPADLAAALDAHPDAVRSATSDVAAVREALVGRGFVETASLDDESQRRDGALAAAFARALLDGLDARERIVRERWTRLSSLALAVVLAAFGAWQLSLALRKDYAEDASWRASSAIAAFPRTGRGVHLPENLTRVFFHTDTEPSPWVEFDLGASKTVRSVVVENREDCCHERAIPLVVEVSADARAWSQAARRDDVFDTWTAEFSRRSARYVRLRALNPTMLHLKSVSIF